MVLGFQSLHLKALKTLWNEVTAKEIDYSGKVLFKVIATSHHPEYPILAFLGEAPT